MKITYHGHSCITIDFPNNKKMIIDPFITGNPLSDLKVEGIKVDYVCVTHAHNDHLGDAIEICEKTGAILIANTEICDYFSYRNIQTMPMNIGGRIKLDPIQIKMTHAIHSSSYVNESNEVIVLGNPCGFLISDEMHQIYHAGDTALFSDMRLLTDEKKRIDIAFIPIGDTYTMGIDDAVSACKYLQPRKVVPIHYNTFESIQQDPMEFKNKMMCYPVQILNSGESIEI